MFFLPKRSTIYFYSQPVDLRKGCEGLAYISSSIINNPSNNTYFVFLNRKRNRAKILYWNDSSLFYWFARSRKGVFAPKQSLTSRISEKELKMILSGRFPGRLKST